MKDYNEFAGVFRWGYGDYTYHNLDYIKFVINTIFHNCEYLNSSDFAEELFEKVDDFAYCDVMKVGIKMDALTLHICSQLWLITKSELLTKT